MKSYVMALVSLITFVCSANAQVLVTGFAFSSSADSWVGQGESYTGYGQVTPYGTTTNGLTISTPVYQYTGSGYLHFTMQYPGNNYWSLTLVAPSAAGLNVGTYQADRFGDRSKGIAGLSFSGNGRGNNWSFGNFTVHEIGYGLDGVVNRLAVDFTQYAVGYMNSPHIALNGFESGQLRINSTIPLNFTAVPEPSTNILMTIGLVGVVWWACRPRRTA